VASIRKDSVEAAKLFNDGEFFAVFIDADHSYEGVRKDIDAWLPKVMPGGILCGHDFDGMFPGVIQAVDESFRDKFSVMGKCWVYRIPKK